MPTGPDAECPPEVRRDYAPAARAVALATGLVLAGLVFVHWARQQPQVARARAIAELGAMPAPIAMPVPVEGVVASRVADTFGAPRGTNRTHHGVDIFAPRGTPVRSATPGLVLAVRDRGLGGRQVWVLGPAHERHYYAHLDDWAPALRPDDRLRAGSLVGTVGDTGNARGTPPHLHYGVYTAAGPIDPLPRLRAAADGPESDPFDARGEAPRSREMRVQQVDARVRQQARDDRPGLRAFHDVGIDQHRVAIERP